MFTRLDCRRRRVRRYDLLAFGLFGAALLVLLASVEVRAEEPPVVEADPEVVDLNEDAVNKAVIGDYDTAIDIFRASLEIQELNVTWMNLGRALQHSGQCDAARAAYEKAVEAPSVTEPSRQEVIKAIFAYREELDEECVADTDETVVSTGEDAASPGDGPDDSQEPDGSQGADPSESADGSEGPDASSQDGPSDDQFTDGELRGDERRASAQPSPAPVQTSTFSPWSWISLGAGVAMLGTMVALDQAVLGPKFDDLEAAEAASDRERFDAINAEIAPVQAANIALLAVGGAAVVTGTVLVVLDLTADDRANAASAHAVPSLAVSEDAASLGWRLEW